MTYTIVINILNLLHLPVLISLIYSIIYIQNNFNYQNEIFIICLNIFQLLNWTYNQPTSDMSVDTVLFIFHFIQLIFGVYYIMTHFNNYSDFNSDLLNCSYYVYISCYFIYITFILNPIYLIHDGPITGNKVCILNICNSKFVKTQSDKCGSLMNCVHFKIYSFNDCQICYEPLVDEICCSTCNVKICQECKKNIMTCPYCRSPYDNI